MTNDYGWSVDKLTNLHTKENAEYWSSQNAAAQQDTEKEGRKQAEAAKSVETVEAPGSGRSKTGAEQTTEEERCTRNRARSRRRRIRSVDN